jgi:large subunit ribosomal protein L32
MAVPKWKRSKSRRNQRRLHIFLEKPTLTKCQKCGHFVLPHTVCPNCGYYKGKEVIDVLAKLTKKERKKREKEIKAKEKEEAETKKPLSWEELSKK